MTVSFKDTFTDTPGTSLGLHVPDHGTGWAALGAGAPLDNLVIDATGTKLVGNSVSASDGGSVTPLEGVPAGPAYVEFKIKVTDPGLFYLFFENDEDSAEYYIGIAVSAGILSEEGFTRVDFYNSTATDFQSSSAVITPDVDGYASCKIRISQDRSTAIFESLGVVLGTLTVTGALLSEYQSLMIFLLTPGDAGANVTLDSIEMGSDQGTALIRDTFTDTPGVLMNAHTGETGCTWSVISGGATADMKIDSTGTRLVGVTGTGSVSDVWLQCSQDLPAIGTDFYVDIVSKKAEFPHSVSFTVLDSFATFNSYFQVTLEPFGNVAYGAGSDGNSYSDNTSSPPAVDTLGNRNVRLVVSGDRLTYKVYIEGALTWTVVFTSFAVDFSKLVLEVDTSGTDGANTSIDSIGVFSGTPSDTLFLEDTFTDAPSTLMGAHIGESGVTWILEFPLDLDINSTSIDSTGSKLVLGTDILDSHSQANFVPSAIPPTGDFYIEVRGQCLTVDSSLFVRVHSSAPNGPTDQYAQLALYVDPDDTSKYGVSGFASGPEDPVSVAGVEPEDDGYLTVVLEMLADRSVINCFAHGVFFGTVTLSTPVVEVNRILYVQTPGAGEDPYDGVTDYIRGYYGRYTPIADGSGGDTGSGGFDDPRVSSYPLPAFIQSGHTRTDDPFSDEIVMGLGDPRVRQIDIESTTSITGTWQMSLATYGGFTDWYQDDLLAGAKPFYVNVMAWGSGLETFVAKFMEPYEAVTDDGLNYTVSAKLRLMPLNDPPAPVASGNPYPYGVYFLDTFSVDIGGGYE